MHPAVNLGRSAQRNYSPAHKEFKQEIVNINKKNPWIFRLFFCKVLFTFKPVKVLILKNQSYYLDLCDWLGKYVIWKH